MGIEIIQTAIGRSRLKDIALTITDPRWRGWRKELTRVRTFLCDAMDGGKEYGTTLQDLDRYFLAYAIAARH